MADTGASIRPTLAGRQEAALRLCHEIHDGLECLALVLAEMAELSASEAAHVNRDSDGNRSTLNNLQ